MYCRSPICGLVRPEPLRPGRGAAADRGLPGRYRQLDPGTGAVVRDLGDRHGQAGASINLGELLSLSLAYREARGVRATSSSSYDHRGRQGGPVATAIGQNHQPRLIRRVQRHKPACRTQISGQRTTMPRRPSPGSSSLWQAARYKEREPLSREAPHRGRWRRLRIRPNANHGASSNRCGDPHAYPPIWSAAWWLRRLPGAVPNRTLCDPGVR